MAKKREGWEVLLYHGVAGSTASTQITNATDIDLDAPVDYGETTVRGAGTSIPHKDRGPVAIDCKITFKMNVKDSDTNLTTLIAAASNTTPTPRAIKYVDPVANTLFDGDCYIKYKHNAPVGGSATVDFECIPTTDGGREWQLGGY